MFSSVKEESYSSVNNNVEGGGDEDRSLNFSILYIKIPFSDSPKYQI